MISLSKSTTAKYQIYYSNSLSHWMGNFSEALLGENPFSPPLICLENIGVQKYIELFLTQTKNITFGNEFIIDNNWLPRLFSLFSCFEKQQKEKQFLYTQGQFQNALIETILGMLADLQCEQKYPSLSNYLNSDSDVKDIPIGISPVEEFTYPHTKHWILAKNLSQSFYEASFEEDHFFENNTQEISNWNSLQLEIWKELHRPDGNYFFVHSIFPQILYELQQNTWGLADSCNLPSAVIFIGPISTRKKELEFLTKLSHFLPITQVLLTPFEKLDELSLFGESLLHQTKICIQHLKELGVSSIHTCFSKFPNNVCAILQNNPFANQLPISDQICITKNPSLWREVETVRDQILQEFQKDPSLQLQDICILTTNLEEYGELIFPFLQNKHFVTIPIKIVGTYGMKYSSICHAIFDLFSFCISKGYTRQMWQICNHECIQKSIFIEQPELDCLEYLQHAYPDVWGYSLEHQQERLRTKNPQIPTLKNLLQNLTNCILKKDPADAEDKLYRETNHIVSLNSLGKLYAVLLSLEEDFSKMYLEKHTIVNWCQKAIFLLQKYITPVNDEQIIELQKIVKELSTMEEKFHKNAWPFGCFYQFLQTILNKYQKHSSHGDSGGIKIGSIQNLAGVESKIVFLMGISEKLFPPKETFFSNKEENSFVLKNWKIRNQLLYTLLGCTQKIYFSYSTEDSIQSPILGEILGEITRLQKKPSYESEVQQSLIQTTKLIPPVWKKSTKKFHDTGPQFEKIASNLPSSLLVTDLQDFLKNSIRSFFKKSLNIVLPRHSIWYASPKWDLSPTKIQSLVYKILLKNIYNPGIHAPITSQQTEQIKQIVNIFIEQEIFWGGISARFIKIQKAMCTKKIIQILQNLREASEKNGIDSEFWKNANIFSLGYPTPQSKSDIQFFTPICVEGITILGGDVLYLKKGKQIILVLPFKYHDNIISTLLYPSLFVEASGYFPEISILAFLNFPQKNDKYGEKIQYIPCDKDKHSTITQQSEKFFLSEKQDVHTTFLKTVVLSYLENYSNPKILYERMLWDIFTREKKVSNSPSRYLQNAFLKEKDRILPREKISNRSSFSCPYGQRFISFWGELEDNHYCGWPENLLIAMDKLLLKSTKNGS